MTDFLATSSLHGMLGEARQIANNAAADEGTIWEDPKTSKCTQIGTYTGPRRRAHIVLSDFSAG